MSLESGVFANGSRELVFPYTQRMAQVVDQAPQKSRILMLGGGVFTLPEHIALKYPDAQVDVVEIDPALQDIAIQHFGYIQPANVRAIAADARAYIQATTQKYDVVLVDVFNEQSIPFSMTTQEFTVRLAGILQPGGVVAVNIIGGMNEQCAPLLASIHASYRTAFAQAQVVPVSDPTLQARQNVIGVYSAAPLAWLDMPNARDDLPRDAAISLTDNFAPVESLLQQCH
jgi:spermidine synthase